MNKSSRSSLASEEEKKRKERRRRREAKERSNRVVYDVIDKLDVTGIYGTGVFHHDGPFDACNPHRNRRRDNRAPMQAFSEGSANNALGGSGPLNKNIDLNQFHGRGAEGFTDYATSRADDLKVRPSRDDGTHWNPKGREYVHGEESVGLGTSTFLEGTAASRTAIQRRESESEGYPPQTGGIQRKKSLAQRFRGISQSRRPFQEGVSPGGRVTSPDARYDPPAIKSPQSAGGALKMYEKNPFFNDYDEAYDKKGATIKQTETEVAKTGRARAPSSPMRGVALERRMTTDAATGDAAPEAKVGGGFLNRVKSLKGGRRSRPERRAS
ncbi:Pal1 cell morphology protein-domain-containing protein [Lineolata rhizophorae]|uniref:Pal1 cell morphology protein-domain-containing protein n=1 Tax=Lineolata rhizophorae TaxID=578093 RepID=A0A6A6NXL4_9PEZI|nr:Pal1 cell morphology protein-domain-containing protein [Lineolata rhizophorae]